MKPKGATSQRTILFRRNVNRSNEDWAHFLEGYRKWLMDFDMEEFGDDWHTAEDIVSEIYLNIIREPLITNLRPVDSFRHTLITLCKRKHRAVTKPWRNGLAKKLCTALQLTRHAASDSLLDIALGIADLVEADLTDKTRDGGRSFTLFSLEDLRRWRKLHAAGTDAKAKDVARKIGVDKSLLSRSCKKVNAFVVERVREIMKRRGFK